MYKRWLLGVKCHSFIQSWNGQQERRRQRSFGRRQEDRILDCAIHYVLNKTYHCELEKDKKRSVRKRAATLVLEDGEVFVQQKNRKVKVIRSREDQLLSVQACHSDPTSGHFGMKTWRRSTYFVLYEWYYCTLPASDKHYWQAKSSNSSSSGDLSFFLDLFVFSCKTSKFKLSTCM